MTPLQSLDIRLRLAHRLLRPLAALALIVLAFGFAGMLDFEAEEMMAAAARCAR